MMMQAHDSASGRIYSHLSEVPTHGRFILLHQSYFQDLLHQFHQEFQESVRPQQIQVGVESYEQFWVVPSDQLAHWLVKKINPGKLTDNLLLFAFSVAEVFSLEGWSHAVTMKMANRVNERVVDAVFTSLTQQLATYLHVDYAAFFAPDQEFPFVYLQQVMKMIEEQFLAINVFVVTLSEHFESQKYQVPLELRPEIITQLQNLGTEIEKVRQFLNTETHKLLSA